MEYIQYDEIKNDMNQELHHLMAKYDLEDIGIYEEEGAGDTYYLGYTVRKDGKIYMVNMPYKKNHEGRLALEQQEWTIQEEEGESKGYHSLEEVFSHINKQ
ncbi:DUF5634 family protein [Bacillus sp. FJAT-49736]|uniref:DUF5634 family protein n=1 Tax=Bacillus sp. FJAT-49736 TaxID=2833582 RepID=UPI001BCA025E|nr:DUF5634 family protein [Bacillus sp. FJAT-49736]MBS4172753.1 DUF5634 family protein [Bacillus sp. FJAT-49736]